MAKRSPFKALLRKIDIHLADGERCCGNCVYHEPSSYLCVNPRCVIGKDITGLTDFRPVTSSLDVCNFHKANNKENKNEQQ